ncbi:MAG: efflux transporter outer membrane subunit, partial [Burkholderiaceae bacterium]|nr:efflux transporter outer membrane subunit [Burkholderiaceae bacterium]
MDARRRYLVAVSVALLLTACAVGPDYELPTTQAVPAYKRETPVPTTTDADWTPASPGRPDTLQWWQVFKDPILDGMMVELGKNNQNIQVSLANLRQALARVQEARASFFPVVGATGSVSRGRSVSGAAVGKTYSAAMQANWELDIWGGIRRSVESSAAEAESRAADLGAVLLSMRCELALNYFQVRMLDTLLGLYDQTITAYSHSLRITENQYKAGTVTRADVAQATAQLRAVEAAKADIRLRRNQTEHAMATLLGVPPIHFELAPKSLQQAHLPVISAGLPATLLERRPDIASAERQVAAANAAIGVAKSAHFPVFSFIASGGYTSPSFSRWLTSPHEIWSLGPSLFLSLFEGGAILARTDQAIAAWESTVAAYRQTVLQAFAEVEDALTASTLLKEEERLQEEAWHAAQEAEHIVKNQYTAGTVDYLAVVVAQASALENARTVIQLKG